MRRTFTNTAAAAIDAGPPGTVASSLAVSGFGDARVTALVVSVDLRHSWVGDLELHLVSPGGVRVLLVGRRGGRGDDLDGTVFDMAAARRIRDAVPPFSGPHRPEGDLGDLAGSPADGSWTLEVHDRAAHDGGELTRWALEVTAEPAPAASDFAIEVRFGEGLTPAQRDAFALAAARWSAIITGDLPPLRVDGEVVDDVLIDAEGTSIDGPGEVLGQAGPTVLRPGSFLPARGVMQFDTADLAQMEADGSLVRVIVHEMAHVLGFGTIWDRLGLRQRAGSVDPVFTGAHSMREFSALTGAAAPQAVPLANEGGPGTRDAHWRESVFGNELLTGFLDQGENPISRLSVACFEDMGYRVDYGAADPYALPGPLALALMGVGAAHADHGGHGIVLVPSPVVASEDALV